MSEEGLLLFTSSGKSAKQNMIYSNFVLTKIILFLKTTIKEELINHYLRIIVKDSWGLAYLRNVHEVS